MAPTAYDPHSPDEQPVPLPSAPLVSLRSHIVLQPPLSRRGHGPGLIIFQQPPFLDQHQDGRSRHDGATKPRLDPAPVQKWAEEGFAVVGITTTSGGGGDGGSTVKSALDIAVSALVQLAEVDIKDKIGVLVYDPQELPSVLTAISGDSRLACIVSYGAHSQESLVPLLSHIPDTEEYVNNNTKKNASSTHSFCHKYPTTASAGAAAALFVLPDSPAYHAGSAAVSHSRSLVFLRKHIGGPHFDIEAIWDEHTYFEFEARSVAKTMGTMVAEPYVNHVPTMTGGVGRKDLTVFYRDHFIFSNPSDTAIQVVSRTVGADRIIDEFIFTLTHNKVVDWLLPGVPPTGRKLAIPMMSVVNVRGDRLYHEHIWWDQAGVLKQAGIIPTHVPYPLPDGKQQQQQTLRLPIAGEEAAKLLADETAGRSNEMLSEEWGVSDV